MEVSEPSYKENSKNTPTKLQNTHSRVATLSYLIERYYLHSGSKSNI